MAAGGSARHAGGTVGRPTIICAVEDSAESTAAARMAAVFAGLLQAEVVLLHSTEAPIAPGASVVPNAHAQLVEAAIEHAEQLLDRVARASGLEEAERAVALDHPADAIVEAAHELGAALVIVGSHGFGALRSLVSGSVSNDVASRAPCPVLVVPPAAVETSGDADGPLSAPAGRLLVR
jgi:nucleotide-binding universal stress UspA family protein